MSQGRKPKRSGQGRQRNRRRYGGPRKANQIEQSKKDFSNTINEPMTDSITRKPAPTGWTTDDPSGAKSFSFTWKCNPVRLSDEKKMADFVVRQRRVRLA